MSMNHGSNETSINECYGFQLTCQNQQFFESQRIRKVQELIWLK